MLKRKNNIVFVEDAHLYYVDGILVPSVTTILGATVFVGKYGNVSDFILQRAAQFGSGVHKAIETHDISDLDDRQLHCVTEYVKLLKRENIKELAHEILLHYNYDYAGTADLLLDYNGEEVLADIKTTYKFDKVYLSWQLSMYARALDFKGRLFGIWLPKPNKANPNPEAVIEEINRVSDEEIDYILKKYKEIKENE